MPASIARIPEHDVDVDEAAEPVVIECRGRRDADHGVRRDDTHGHHQPYQVLKTLFGAEGEPDDRGARAFDMGYECVVVCVDLQIDVPASVPEQVCGD